MADISFHALMGTNAQVRFSQRSVFDKSLFEAARHTEMQPRGEVPTAATYTYERMVMTYDC